MEYKGLCYRGMGDFATTSWLLFGFLHLIFAAVAAGLRFGLWRFDEKPPLAWVFETLGIKNGLGFLDEVVEGFEASIDAGKSHVGHLVEATEPLGDQFADGLAGDFLVVALVDLLFHLIRDALQLFELNGPFVAGALQAGEDFLAIEGHSRAVFFDDSQADVLFDAFVGGEALFAIEASPPAANGPIPFSCARIDHF